MNPPGSFQWFWRLCGFGVLALAAVAFVLPVIKLT